jgi:hypothetical protein
LDNLFNSLEYESLVTRIEIQVKCVDLLAFSKDFDIVEVDTKSLYLLDLQIAERDAEPRSFQKDLLAEEPFLVQRIGYIGFVETRCPVSVLQ